MENRMNLQSLVTHISGSLMPIAVSRHSLIINEVADDIGIETRSDILAHLIGEVLCALIQHNEQDCFRISAKPFSNIILFHIRGRIRRDSPGLMLCLERLEPLAESLGGCISLQHYEGGGACVSISFLRNKKTGIPVALTQAY